MTPEEKVKKIEEIYDETMKKLSELFKQRHHIVNTYTRELEEQKMKMIRDSLK